MMRPYILKKKRKIVHINWCSKMACGCLLQVLQGFQHGEGRLSVWVGVWLALTLSLAWGWAQAKWQSVCLDPSCLSLFCWTSIPVVFPLCSSSSSSSNPSTYSHCLYTIMGKSLNRCNWKPIVLSCYSNFSQLLLLLQLPTPFPFVCYFYQCKCDRYEHR